jgi:hypothetical protein
MSFAKFRSLLSVDVDLVWGTLRTRESMFLVVRLNTLRDWKDKRYRRNQMSWGMKVL